MKGYVEELMPWKSDLFKETFEPELVRVVILNENLVGMLKTKRECNFLYLGDIMILPEFQNSGLGTKLMNLVASEASEQGAPLRLKVLKNNPAKKLYDRLGFRVIESDEFYYRMEKAV
jgi:ribosomal protein S18 acetylase RimI-like enzyme